MPVAAVILNFVAHGYLRKVSAHLFVVMEATVSEGIPTEHETNGNKNAIAGSEGDLLDVNEDKPDNVDLGAPDGPMKILKPLRTDAVKALQSRQRRLERLPASLIPELHYVGQIISGKGIVLDSSEGACCR